jgi:hypothetical protein
MIDRSEPRADSSARGAVPALVTGANVLLVNALPMIANAGLQG